MTKQELLDILSKCAENYGDKEGAHQDADEALLKFINDPEITEAFHCFEKWYA